MIPKRDGTIPALGITVQTVNVYNIKKCGNPHQFFKWKPFLTEIKLTQAGTQIVGHITPSFYQQLTIAPMATN